MSSRPLAQASRPPFSHPHTYLMWEIKNFPKLPGATALFWEHHFFNISCPFEPLHRRFCNNSRWNLFYRFIDCINKKKNGRKCIIGCEMVFPNNTARWLLSPMDGLNRPGLVCSDRHVARNQWACPTSALDELWSAFRSLQHQIWCNSIPVDQWHFSGHWPCLHHMRTIKNLII